MICGVFRGVLFQKKKEEAFILKVWAGSVVHAASGAKLAKM